jgi:hypothetical protein
MNEDKIEGDEKGTYSCCNFKFHVENSPKKINRKFRETRKPELIYFLYKVF